MTKKSFSGAADLQWDARPAKVANNATVNATPFGANNGLPFAGVPSSV